MKFKYTALLFAILLLAPTAAAMADGGDIAIIINAENKEEGVSIRKVKRFYSDMDISWPSGQAVHLYSLPVNHSTRKLFNKMLLSKESLDVEIERTEKTVFGTIKNRPIKILTEKEVVKKVAMDSQGIAYVRLMNVGDGVKVIHIMKKKRKQK